MTKVNTNVVDCGEHRFLQFNLWKDCNNNCEFCFYRGHKLLSNEKKISSINFVKERLLDLEESDFYNEIGFIGGEFFDNQIEDESVKKAFYELFDILKDKRERGKLDRIYITTNLIFDSNKLLRPFLDYLKELNLLDITLLCTSYDLKYRFHNEKALQYWQDNMINLSKDYNTMIHTEIIVTQAFIDAVMNGSFNIEDFCNKYNTRIDYIEPSSGFYFYDKKECEKEVKDFFPKREDFLNFIRYTAIDNDWIDLTKFLSMRIRSDTLYCHLKGQWRKLEGRRSQYICPTLGLYDVTYENGYCDSKASMVDDVNAFLGSV